MRKRTHHRGQALVEFALSITLIFLFLSAIIDLGLAFFAYQGVAGAAQEGAAYAATLPLTETATNVTIASDDIARERARYEGGVNNTSTANRASFVNLLDLDNNGADDSLDPAVKRNYIRIKSVQNDVALGDLPAYRWPCEDSRNGKENPTSFTPIRHKQYCDMQVTVTYKYKPFFSFASLLGLESIDISATRQVTITR